MKTKIVIGTLAVILLGGVGVTAAVDPSLEGRIEAVVAPYVAAGDFMGVIALQHDGQPPLILPYGRASVELGVAHQGSNVFMVGSVSKQFTAAAVLLLEEAGALTVEDGIGQHLPGFPHGESVTIHHLLTHTSGIADIYSLPRFGDSEGRGGTLAQVIADLGAIELAFEPGTGYAYSNGGYAVAAAIIERASGLSYGDYLARHIFQPLGMASSAHDSQGPAVIGRVPGYDPWGTAGLTPALPVAAAFTVGSGSLWSSAEDLLRWSAALHGGKLLSAASYAKLTRDYGRGYGYGVSVFERFDRRVFGHDGRVAGYSSDLARYVEDGVTVVVLSNVQSVARDEIRTRVAAEAFGIEGRLAEARSFVSNPPESLEDLVGRYAFGPNFHVTIAVEGGRLMARANQGGWSELAPLVDGSWFSRMLYATVRFGRDEAGTVDRLIWGAGEGAPVGPRVLAAPTTKPADPSR